MEIINIDYLKKIEIKVGTVTAAERLDKSEKLLKLTVDFGIETRTILSGIAKQYDPQALIGKQLPFITNLEEREMMGLKSQGMLFAVDGSSGPVLLLPDKAVDNGSSVI